MRYLDYLLALFVRLDITPKLGTLHVFLVVQGHTPVDRARPLACHVSQGPSQLHLIAHIAHHASVVSSRKLPQRVQIARRGRTAL